MEKTLEIQDGPSIQYFEDDTIEAVLQQIAIKMDTHPDRLFVLCQTQLPREYYSSHPIRWMNLFHRIAKNKKEATVEEMGLYLSDVRPGTGITPRAVSFEEWEAPTGDLEVLRSPPASFVEYRVCGVSDASSYVIPKDVKDVQVPEGRRPIPQLGMLFSSVHPYPIDTLIVVKDEGTSTQLQQSLYFPRLTVNTPANISGLVPMIEKERGILRQLLALTPPTRTQTAIQRIKWRIPLADTHFTAVRSRFEQIFYGLTVSPTTPYICYSVRGETQRHKFYVEDPATKEPLLDRKILQSWWNSTLTPRGYALVLFRGKSRRHYDRISISPTDILVTLYRDMSSVGSTQNDLLNEALTWLKSMDAVMAYVEPTDIEPGRWEFVDSTAVGVYEKEVTEFDLQRMGCLGSLFSVHSGGKFRFLRADHSTDVEPLELKILSILNDPDTSARDKEAIRAELGVSNDAFTPVWERVTAEDYRGDHSVKSYPLVRFKGNVAMVTTSSDMDRVLRYTDLLRYILSAPEGTEDVDEVCPRNMTVIQPTTTLAPPEETLMLEDTELDIDIGDLMEDIPAPAPAPAPVAEAPVPTTRKLKLDVAPTYVHNYFVRRAQTFDPSVFDGTYATNNKGIDKQVVIVKGEEWKKIDDMTQLYYANAPDTEKLELVNEAGETAIAICPEYWCYTDNVPLAESDLIRNDEGAPVCPLCRGALNNGKQDLKEFPLIRRRDAKNTAKYPGFSKNMSSSGKPQPTCYKTVQNKHARILGDVPATTEDANKDISYVMQSGKKLGPTRLGKLPPALVSTGLFPSSLTSYATTLKDDARLIEGKSVLLRVGLGRPSSTLPSLLADPRPIEPPSMRPDLVRKCSFYRNWRDIGSGATLDARILAGIQHAYETQGLSILQEVEFVAKQLRVRVILVNQEGTQVLCGFGWSELTTTTPILVLIGEDVLGLVVKHKTGPRAKTLQIGVDVRKMEGMEASLTKLIGYHTRACSELQPSFEDAMAEITRTQDVPNAKYIGDPLGRIQAVAIPYKVVLPCLPSANIPAGVDVLEGYHAFDEYPAVEDAEEYLNACSSKAYHVVQHLQDVDGNVVELLLECQFRSPVDPTPAEEADYSAEVTATLRTLPEATLVSGEPNNEDTAKADQISYEAEVFEFLLFCLSRDVVTDESGETLRTEYSALRKALIERSDTLPELLREWYDAEVQDVVESGPVAFVNKVRKPCGQMEDANMCASSSLCGWDAAQNKCKVKVREDQVKKTQLLRRMAHVLLKNDKQRALVLDGRMSPFFSTVLYLEMPNEVITTSL